jgi:hypothetical protein
VASIDTQERKWILLVIASVPKTDKGEGIDNLQAAF